MCCIPTCSASNTWGRLLGKLAGVPVIIAHEHWSSKAGREIWVDRLLYRLSDRIIVPSAASKHTRHGDGAYSGTLFKRGI